MSSKFKVLKKVEVGDTTTADLMVIILEMRRVKKFV